jgi:hypothetical protein
MQSQGNFMQLGNWSALFLGGELDLCGASFNFNFLLPFQPNISVLSAPNKAPPQAHPTSCHSARTGYKKKGKANILPLK